MFFIDKYFPQKKSDILFHNDLLETLEMMSKDDSIPHMIFHGPSGSGKQTLIKLFLEMIFPGGVTTREYEYTVSGSGNSQNIIDLKQSDNHIVIEPFNTNFDKYLIQSIVKQYAMRMPLMYKKPFKVVLINNIDNLSYYAQTSLRRTMEVHSNTCRFIMVCNSLSKVIEPLKSRCFCFKVRAPTYEEHTRLVQKICLNEKRIISLTDTDRIITQANANTRTLLWLLQLFCCGCKSTELETSYDAAIKEVCGKILEMKLTEITPVKNSIRSIIYKIMMTNINGSKIITDIMNRLLDNTGITDEQKCEIISNAAISEHNLIRGRREIIHLDYFIIATMNTLKSPHTVPVKSL